MSKILEVEVITTWCLDGSLELESPWVIAPWCFHEFPGFDSLGFKSLERDSPLDITARRIVQPGGTHFVSTARSTIHQKNVGCVIFVVAVVVVGGGGGGVDGGSDCSGG